MVSATMSTLPCSTYGMRWADVIAMSCTLFGSPKMALATSRTTSMSKPSICPVAGFRYPKRLVFWSTPTLSRPLSAMRFMVEPPGMAPGAGSEPSGRRLARVVGLPGAVAEPLEGATGAVASAAARELHRLRVAAAVVQVALLLVAGEPGLRVALRAPHGAGQGGVAGRLPDLGEQAALAVRAGQRRHPRVEVLVEVAAAAPGDQRQRLVGPRGQRRDPRLDE